jgi:GWxTD domain-containing protein
MKKIFIVFLLGLGVTFAEEGSPFFFDAICFKSASDTLSRIDIFVLVPYGSVSFFRKSSNYVAEYELSFAVLDSLRNRVNSQNISKTIVEKEQLETLGRSAKFQQVYTKFELPEGRYTFEVTLYDKNSNITYTKTRSTNALNFARYQFSMSGLMFVSDIESVNSSYKITPYLSDNLGDLKSVFLFFEIYQRTTNLSASDFVIQVFNNKLREIYRSSRVRREIGPVSQIYLPFALPSSLASGSYSIRVVALKPLSNDSIFTNDEILSVAERTFAISPSISTMVVQNLDKSIRQLKYVAYQSDIDYINEGSTPEEKLLRFEDFWRKLDPTPSTDYNEAFEEYYQRIQYANQNFKSYLEGWQTDRGMVYIVLGSPMTIQEQRDYSYSNRTYEIWSYANNRTFIFVDYSGFGDFRLYSPPTFSEKYKYHP